MSAVTVNTPYPTFTDIDGQPLEDGYVWIGVSGLEPQANPQTAYWDAALTQVVTQPARTRGGYPLNGTAIGRLYTAAPYSIKVQNKNSSTIVLDLTGAAGTGVGSISFGTTGLTPAVATDGDVVVAGTLAVANGGTGVTTSTGTGSVVLSASPTITGPTVSSGNLAFSGTAQRITGDFSNLPWANRLAFQTSTVNGNTNIPVLPNGTGTASQIALFGNSDPTNASYAQLVQIGATETRLTAAIQGTGTYTPLTFYTGGSERVRVDTSGNVALGTTNTGTAGLSISQNLNLSWEQSATESVPNLFRQTSSAALVMSVGYKRSATANGFASSFGSSLAKTAISLGTTAGAITFYTDTAATTAVGTDVTPTERMRIDSSGNVGIGTASPSYRLDVQGGTASFTGSSGANAIRVAGAGGTWFWIDNPTTSTMRFSSGATAGTGAVVLDSSGNVGIGTASPSSYGRLGVMTPTANNGFFGIANSAGGAGGVQMAQYYSTVKISYIDTTLTNGTPGSETAYLAFATANSGTLAERMRIDSSGNVNIATLGARITADFSNATLTNRVAFQTNTANSATSVTALPNGSSTDSNFTVSANSDPTNASVGQLRASSSAVVIASTRTGSGTFLPLQFQTSGAVAMTVNTGGNVVQGISALSTTATDGFLWITSCAGAPTGAPTAPYTNAAALICDTTNNRLYVRVAGTWRYTTLT